VQLPPFSRHIIPHSLQNHSGFKLVISLSVAYLLTYLLTYSVALQFL
jgi:hypothetical protein